MQVNQGGGVHHRVDTGEGDTFSFQYATANRKGKLSWSSVLTVSATSAGGYVSASLPSSLSGEVLIRVIDNNATRGRTALDAIVIDHLRIRVQ